MFTSNPEFNKMEMMSLRRQLGYCRSKKGIPSECNEACHNVDTEELSKPINCPLFKPGGVWTK